MGFNEIISRLFGNKNTRDMKEIEPWVAKIKEAYPEIEKLSHDELRAKTTELKQFLQDYVKEQREEVERLKASVEETELEHRAELFTKIDKL